MFQVFYSDHFPLPLPEGHRFPAAKYRLLRELLLNEGTLNENELFPSLPASEDELKAAHTQTYIEQIRTGTVPKEILMRIGFPWTPDLFWRSAASTGGTIAASLSALTAKVSGNLAGGTHHAHRDRGEGYCVFNDIAVAAALLLQNGQAQKIGVLDLDVHQGNGTASIFQDENRVMTISLHGEKNYPFKKIPSDFDFGLPNGTNDDEYLKILDQALAHLDSFAPDFLFYQMGVDGLREDKLGKLDLTLGGLMERDQRVFTWTQKCNVPLVLTLGGGYAEPIELTVRASANTYLVLKKIYAKECENLTSQAGGQL